MTLNAAVASPIYTNIDGEDVVEPYFSWSACEECNTTLGGDRYDIIYREYDETIGQFGPKYEAMVCIDCYIALCS